MEVLVVCTGNICRSPMAVGLLGQRLARAGADVTVASAGFVTRDRPASEFGVDAMARRGIDISAHRSRVIEADHVAAADLVVCMEREHVREVAVLTPDAFRRTFTLPELARRCLATGPRADGESVEVFLGRVGEGRRVADLMGRGPEDEVADPIGRSSKEYERTAAELEHLVDVVVGHLFPGVPATSSSRA